MINIPRAVIGALLAWVLLLDAGAARAERSTIVGNAGTLTLEWQASHDKAGRPIIEGQLSSYGGMSGYCRPRLLVETLDEQGKVTASNLGFIPGYLGGFDRVWFEEPIRAPGPAYRVSVVAWDKCGGGAGGG
ncbi:MAG TPA: hypothetical protein VEL75_12480 [Candidatus Methylomirabilis sp.]|nr:hypothetical protein [Candidatus Methylomirabilis sp.]